jgi:D-alanyl-lipoteichoic acid acyltransferase DltB (MBOAT superfamily)
MGFELMRNFRQPYLVASPSAFWQNWHISLSTWLRDYLYIPLGGNRYGPLRTYRNLLITMGLGGLWHGAGWAYLIWGIYHGVLLIVQKLIDPALAPLRAWAGRSRARGIAWRVLAVVFFFHLTCIGWLIFRAGALPNDRQWDFLWNTFPRLFASSNWQLGLVVLRVILPIGLLALLLQWKDDLIEAFHAWAHTARKRTSRRN